MTSKDVYGQKKVKDIDFSSKSFPFDCITLSKDPEPEVSGQRNIIWRFLVADDTGSMIMKIWGEQGESIVEGDILHLHDAEVRQYLGLPYVTLSRSGYIQRIGRDIFLYSDKPNRSEVLRDSNLLQSMPQTASAYGQQQKFNPSIRPGSGKQVAVNPTRFQQIKTPPTGSGPFNQYQANQQQQGPPMPATLGEPSFRGGSDRGRGGKRGRGRGRGRFRDRDQPDRSSPVPDRSFSRPDSDHQVTPMKRDFDDTNAPARQRSRVKYDKV